MLHNCLSAFCVHVQEKIAHIHAPFAHLSWYATLVQKNFMVNLVYSYTTMYLNIN